MSAIKSIALTVFGQLITGVGFAVGESVLFSFTCQNPADRTVLNLTGWTLRASLCAPDLRGNPKLPAIVERACTLVDALNGVASWALAPADTQPSATPIVPGTYFLGLTAFDGASNEMQLGMIVVNVGGNPTIS